MMQREKLTPERIRRFSRPDGVRQAFLWDTEAPRLAVRATAGAKSFIFEAKLNRRTIRRTIGDVRSWNVADARVEARRLATLVDQGLDPRELEREEHQRREAEAAAQEQARRAAEERSQYTLHALCDSYVRLLIAAGKRKSAADARSTFKCHVLEANPDIASTPAAEVSARQVAQMVRSVREAGKERTAGILRSYLSAAFNAAKRAPFDSTLPAELIPFGIDHNPTSDIPAIAVQRGNRVLTRSELQTYMEALDQNLADDALRLALLSGGQRMAQLLRARVSDYQAEAKTLRLWDNKGKRAAPREHLLPLGPVASALVDRLVERARSLANERANDAADPWLFSTAGRTLMDPGTPSKRLADISKAMGSRPFSLRDIRRTVETMLAEMGISRDVRAQLLSHGISGVQMAHYDRHDYMQEKRHALARWELHLQRLGEDVTPQTAVIALPSAG